MFSTLDKSLPLCTAMRETFARGYTARNFKQDVIAAFVVSLVALPLSMALAIAVGLPPQHGIYTAIIAGIMTPLLGGSITQVSGPTAAFVVIIAPIVAEYGLRGIILAEIMAGVMLVLLAWAKLGRFITFVPYPVTTGFTAGIAVVLGTLSLNDLLGLGIEKLQGSFVDKVALIITHLPAIQFPEACIGLVSLLVMFTGKRISKHIPSAILGVLVGTLLGLWFTHTGVGVSTIGSRFSFELEGIIHQGIPPLPPTFHLFGEGALFAWPTFRELQILSMPAFVIAALAALESLLSATVADGLTRTKHNPNGELAAIGFANIASGFTMGIPATGAIARTTTNIKSGAHSPLASSMHGLFILLFVLCLAPLINYVPMASLAALLLLTAYNMSHYRQFFRILNIAPREDIMVLLACFGLTVFIDMVAGVTVGILLASLLFIKRVSAMAEVTVDMYDDMANTRLPPNVMVYHISGPLFFATVERTLDRTAFLRNRIDTLVLDLQQVPLVDMSGLVALKNLLMSDVLVGKRIIICAKPDILSKIMQKLAGENITHIKTAASVDAALAQISPS